MIDEDVWTDDASFTGLTMANVRAGNAEIPRQVGRLRQEVGHDMGTRGEPRVCATPVTAQQKKKEEKKYRGD
jgi:hypothetical protein